MSRSLYPLTRWHTLSCAHQELWKLISCWKVNFPGSEFNFVSGFGHFQGIKMRKITLVLGLIHSASHSHSTLSQNIPGVVGAWMWWVQHTSWNWCFTKAHGLENGKADKILQEPAATWASHSYWTSGNIWITCLILALAFTLSLFRNKKKPKQTNSKTNNTQKMHLANIAV